MQLIDTLRHLFHPQRSNNHRPRVLHPEGFLVFAILAVGFWLSLAPAKVFLEHTGNVLGFASNITASQVVTLTNSERAKQGLSQLTVNSLLNQAAQAKAAHMFAHQYWAHVAPDGTQPWQFFKDVNYRYAVAGENLARDFSNTNDMVAAWMASPTHRANIMNDRYKEIGVAVVDGKLLGTDTTLVVQLFGDPLGGVPQISPAAKKVVKVPARKVVLGAEATPIPATQPQQMTVAENQPTVTQPNNSNMPPAEILSSVTLPVTDLPNPQSTTPIFSPLQLTKVFFLSVIILLVLTLLYDSFVMHNRNTVRLVGKNLAHIMLLVAVGFLLILFKGGVIG